MELNKRQKLLLRNILMVLAITLTMVLGAINLRDWINRQEAIRAMQRLGEVLLKYRQEYGAVPPQSYLDRAKQQLVGYVRFGNMKYRARWIGFDAGEDEILAYSRMDFNSLILSDGYVVLRLSGKVQWMPKAEFERS